MFIYVSGPYSAPADAPRDQAEALVQRHVERANAVALKLVAKGHAPFVPHTMMLGWEDQYGVPRDSAMRVCRQWVTRCDALFYIASSPGADMELAVARQHGLVTYRQLDEVPRADSALEAQ